MKKITTLLFAVLLAFQSFAQNPDPELFRTWNLYKIEVDFGGATYISNIDPPISPYLTINRDLSFEGFGACNSFSGNFEYQGNDILRPIDYSETTDNCETEFLNDFETVFFEFFSLEDDYGYNIYTDPSDNLQHMYYTNNPFGVWLDFIAGEPLSIVENNFEIFQLYPNPVSDQLFISSEKSNVKTMAVFSTTGQKVLEIEGSSNSIDVSSLSKGMYFLEINSEEGKSVQKFIKK